MLLHPCQSVLSACIACAHISCATAQQLKLSHTDHRLCLSMSACCRTVYSQHELCWDVLKVAGSRGSAHSAGGHGKAVPFARHLSNDTDLARHSVMQGGEHPNVVRVKRVRRLHRLWCLGCFLAQSAGAPLPGPVHPVAACADVATGAEVKVKR